jgi:hypothetical protein
MMLGFEDLKKKMLCVGIVWRKDWRKCPQEKGTCGRNIRKEDTGRLINTQ